jgi:hypothetical protein
MALKKTEIVPSNIVGDVQVSCYIKVTMVSADKTNVVSDVLFRKDTAEGAIIKSVRHSFAPNMQGENFIKQAYEHLKTLPEFANAVDC